MIITIFVYIFFRLKESANKTKQWNIKQHTLPRI